MAKRSQLLLYHLFGVPRVLFRQLGKIAKLYRRAMNKILNGDFSSGFDHWNSGVLQNAFVLDDGMAWSRGMVGETPKKHDITQQFNLNDEVAYAKITVWGKWWAQGGEEIDGYNRFIVKLEKPDKSKVTLLDITKTAVTSEGYLLNGVDIKSHFSQYGNYTLWLNCWCRYADEGGPSLRSMGWYDNISVNIAVKKYKSVHEKMGGVETLSPHASHQYKSVAESIGLVEKYNVKISKTVAEAIGLSESYETDVKEAQFKAVAESIGLVEAYSIKKTLHRSAAESIGLVETLQAKRTQGNLETTYTIDQLTQWSEVDRVTTPWVKVTKIIP